MINSMKYWLIPVLFSLPLIAGQVEIAAKPGGGFTLMRDGKPYTIYGAGGTSRMELLKPAGANSIRDWSPPSIEVMDKAQQLGLTVLAGLRVGNPRHGFDYNDAAKVQAQRDQALAAVRKLKGHPALLMWALGNETELGISDAQRIQVWKEMETLAQLVKKEDPSHPVIVVLASAGKTKLKELAEHTPSIDAVGINAYGGMLQLPETVEAQGWKKAWLVTEFGPRGHWEVAKTPWGLPIEDFSSVKAEFYKKAYNHAIRSRPACLGSYVFLWGQKQEKTHTWYGMFMPDGTPLDTVDAMTEMWTGKPPAQRAPSITGFEVSKDVLKTGEALSAKVSAERSDGITWDLRRDVSDNPATGGDREAATPILERGSGAEFTVKMPAAPGNYRLFVYARNASGKASTANKALKVE
jgi:hypothetical protein